MATTLLVSIGSPESLSSLANVVVSAPGHTQVIPARRWDRVAIGQGAVHLSCGVRLIHAQPNLSPKAGRSVAVLKGELPVGEEGLWILHHQGEPQTTVRIREIRRVVDARAVWKKARCVRLVVERPRRNAAGMLHVDYSF